MDKTVPLSFTTVLLILRHQFFVSLRGPCHIALIFHSVERAQISVKVFNLTTFLQQAESWADRQFRDLRRRRGIKQSTQAVVLRFEVDRNQLASLLSLCFVTDRSNPDYWNFIEHCRTGMGPHLLHGNKNYDVVFGPVTLWPQKFVIKDADQVSFHTKAALEILPAPVLHSRGTPTYIL